MTAYTATPTCNISIVGHPKSGFVRACSSFHKDDEDLFQDEIQRNGSSRNLYSSFMETIPVSSPPSALTAYIPPNTSRANIKQNGSVKKSSRTPACMVATGSSNGSNKPKQSKSRNGCHTCKKKRLKCDEIKPTCNQCRRRKVPCEGYRKNFKWRVSNVREAPASQSHDQDVTYEGPEPLSPAFIGFNPMPVQAPLGQRPALSGIDVSPSLFSPISFPYPSPHTPLKSYPDYQDSNTTPPTCGPPLNDFPIIPPPSSTDPACLSCRSPDPTNIYLPGTDFKQSLKYGHTSYHLSEPTFQPNIFGSNADRGMIDVGDDVEEIPREFEPSIATAVRLPSPPISESSSGSDESQLDLIAQHLHFDQNSSELLMARFDRDTCGILSVKDGQSENPWRTMVWPLARSSDSPALYHAIHAMTAFHASKRTPSLQVEGMSHMQRSLHHLRNGIQNMSMCTETALATTLALAFSVSWDQHTLTGSEHLRGASALVDNAIVKYKQSGLHGAEIERLRFLCNTWIYMDVLSRLTTMDGGASSDYENFITPLQGPANVSHEVDPLMGCATTLFPLIGRVANLVREVWRSSTNSVKIISTATDLKEAIKRWAPPTSVEAPEDPDCAIYHSLETAEAYRWATLLYLHQAVPETPSCTSADLALRVLKHLANVPSTSRASIVHIYPLLAAGCEFVDEENRAWVEDRWSHMMQRMLIGNIDRCWEVTKEVWRRRDAKMQQEEEQRARLQAMSQRSTGFMVPIGLLKQKNTNSSSSSGDGPTSDNNESEARKRKLCCEPQDSSLPERQRTASVDTVEKMDPEKTVKGRLHWLGVMKDWRWEVLLG